MIEHKEVREAIRKLINEIDGEYGCVSRYPKKIKEAVDICFNYSTEQEKKDELLELYKKLAKEKVKMTKNYDYYKRYAYSSSKNDPFYQDYKKSKVKVKEITNKIKALEEALK